MGHSDWPKPYQGEGIEPWILQPKLYSTNQEVVELSNKAECDKDVKASPEEEPSPEKQTEEPPQSGGIW